MTSILYAIGFTLMFCLSAFIGWSDNYSTLISNVCLMFSGFCLGGIVVLVMENRSE